MQTQIEARFLSIDLADSRQRLENLMATLTTPMRLVRCAITDPDRIPESKGVAWTRVRDGGNKVTLTYKEVIEQRRGGTKEITLTIDSYGEAIELLEKLGFPVISVQQSRRETWHLGTVSIILEEWPWIKPFIKIAGPSEAAIRDVSARLGLAWSQAVFGSTTLAYAAEFPGVRLDLGENIAQIEEIKFGAPLPYWLKKRRNP